jgi:hypothetical protein
MERFARDKHSSLLRKPVKYSRKKFYSTGPFDSFPYFSAPYLSFSYQKNNLRQTHENQRPYARVAVKKFHSLLRQWLLTPLPLNKKIYSYI